MIGQKCAFQDCDKRQGPGDVWPTMRDGGRNYEVCEECSEKTGAFHVVGGALVREK